MCQREHGQFPGLGGHLWAQGWIETISWGFTNIRSQDHTQDLGKVLPCVPHGDVCPSIVPLHCARARRPCTCLRWWLLVPVTSSARARQWASLCKSSRAWHRG